MNTYLLSVHSAPNQSCGDMPPEEMQAAMQRIETLEADMKSSGTWMFSARLTDASSATVVAAKDGEVLTTDGPYVESKEHIAGFYIIQATDLDSALAWATKVSTCVGQPIEVRPFAGFKAD